MSARPTPAFKEASDSLIAAILGKACHDTQECRSFAEGNRDYGPAVVGSIRGDKPRGRA